MSKVLKYSLLAILAIFPVWVIYWMPVGFEPDIWFVGTLLVCVIFLLVACFFKSYRINVCILAIFYTWFIALGVIKRIQWSDEEISAVIARGMDPRVYMIMLIHLIVQLAAVYISRNLFYSVPDEGPSGNNG